MDALLSLPGLLNVMTLTGLEIVLGIDNVIFIALIVLHLPVPSRGKVRFIGLSVAMMLRIMMLLGISWVIGLREPLFHMFGLAFSGRSMMMLSGGGFLIVKPLLELREMFRVEDGHQKTRAEKKKTALMVMIEIIFIDLILSFDSILTAIGLTTNLISIVVAIFIAMLVMLVAAKPIGDFIASYPSIKVMALVFILLVGVLLVASGFAIEVDKTYLYSAMGFSLLIEIITIRLQKKRQ